MAVTFATQRYCVPGGAGTKTGVDWANAWDLAQAFADTTADVQVNMSGDFTRSTQLLSTHNTTRCYIGWNAAQDDYWTFDDMPAIDFAGLASGTALIPNNSQAVIGIEIKNTPDIAMGDIAKDSVRYFGCKITDCGGGVQGDNYCALLFCRFEGVGGLFLWDPDSGGIAFGNEAIGCTATDGLIVQSQCHNFLNFVQNSGNAIRFATSLIGQAFLNTLDGATVGIKSAGTQPQMRIGDLITNCTTGEDVSTTHVYLELATNFYNNATDRANGKEYAVVDATTLDPIYGGIGAGDYSITEATLLSRTLRGLQQLPNTGAFQGGRSGGGGGGNYRPRITKG